MRISSRVVGVAMSSARENYVTSLLSGSFSSTSLEKKFSEPRGSSSLSVSNSCEAISFILLSSLYETVLTRGTNLVNLYRCNIFFSNPCTVREFRSKTTLSAGINTEQRMRCFSCADKPENEGLGHLSTICNISPAGPIANFDSASLIQDEFL
jgi:hypothetical protein